MAIINKIKGNIELGTMADVDELEKLYDDVNDYFQTGFNYPGWLKGIYPVRETAIAGIADGNLFTLKIGNRIAGSVILNHKPEEAYNQVTWGIEAQYNEIMVIHTLVVHPDFMKQGVAQRLVDFAKDYAVQQHAKAIRLDVSVHNAPAISLYEKSGYRHVGTVDLGLGYEHLIWFKLYELIVASYSSIT